MLRPPKRRIDLVRRRINGGQPAVRAVPLPYGSPVLPVHRGKACAIAFDLSKMSGIARRGGVSPYGYAPGEMVPIQTGGGIKAQLAADTDLMIGGVQRRLLASEPHYFQLRAGKIVG